MKIDFLKLSEKKENFHKKQTTIFWKLVVFLNETVPRTAFHKSITSEWLEMWQPFSKRSPIWDGY